MIDRSELQIPGNIILADLDFYKPSEIEVLIGAELFYQLLCVGQIKLNNTGLILQKTRLGWVVSGALHKHHSETKRIACNLVVDSLNEQVSKFFELENVPRVKHLSNEEKYCEKYFLDTHFRDSSGRYGQASIQ